MAASEILVEREKKKKSPAMMPEQQSYNMDTQSHSEGLTIHVIRLLVWRHGGIIVQLSCYKNVILWNLMSWKNSLVISKKSIKNSSKISDSKELHFILSFGIGCLG
jgi:hypothetical protein